VRTLKMQDAAAQLNVSPSALRSWERRFGYPVPTRTAGGHRHYAYGEIIALRDALEAGLSISSAIGRAREALIGTSPEALARVLSAYEFERADAAMEAALALRTLERAVEDVLLASMTELATRLPPGSAPWALAAGWADGWLRRARRMCPAPWSSVSVLIADATDYLDLDALYLRTLELLCLRGGMAVTTIPVDALVGIQDVLRAVEPDVLLVAGNAADQDAVARCIYTLQRALGRRTIAIYRRSGIASGLSQQSSLLADLPSHAHQQLLELATDKPRVLEPARGVA
jgi:DNA-binding transcriptional MerR regulator